MSACMLFYSVTPGQLAEAITHPDEVREFCNDSDSFDGLEVSWSALVYLLEAADAPVDLMLDGSHSFDEMGYYFGWTADEVAQAARRLRATPFERLAQHYDAAAMTESDDCVGFWDDDDLDFLKDDYEALVQFFETTADSGSAAIRFLG